jgi:hypothetical protein
MGEIDRLRVTWHDLVPGHRVVRPFGRNGRRRLVVRQRLRQIGAQHLDTLGCQHLFCADDLQRGLGTGGLAVEFEGRDQCLVARQGLRLDVLDALPLARGTSSPLFKSPVIRTAGHTMTTIIRHPATIGQP